MKIKYIVYLILLIGLGSLIGYRIIKSRNSEGNLKKGMGKKMGDGEVVQVNGIVVQPSEFLKSISINGALEAEQEVKITSQSAGIITKLFFKEGSYIQKGQLLMMIDNTELEAKLAEAMTNQSLASETEKRAILLIKSGAISQQEYDVAKANMKSMQAQTELVKAQLAKTQIRAPFSGKIGLSSVAIGQYITPTDIITSLVSLDPIKITFSIPDKYSTAIGINTVVQFKVSGSDKTYQAKVLAIEPVIEQTTRTLRLKAWTANPNEALLPGAFAQIELPISNIKNAIRVPSEAIVPIQDGQKVFISERGTAKEIKVDGSMRTDTDVLITSGLKVGDTVITSGNMALKLGTRVKVNISNN